MTELTAISRQVWDMKYRLKATDGTPLDQTIESTWRRVAAALAAPEAEPEFWAERFYGALGDFQFLPAGRILAGAGTARDVTLFNCFVMGAIPDDMGGIFSHLREAALTLQQGGGIGYDFSTLRPRGAPVAGVGADASGPISFMEVWDAMCHTIMSAGARRGAMMATLRCDHPDIEDFIAAKRIAGRLTMFNLSVLVTDAFLEAVDGDSPWPLVFDGKVYRTLGARALWDRIMQATYDSAEPGVIFIDRINRRNNLWYCEEIHATNPCGEQPLPPYGACLLGSINLASLVCAPFEAEAELDQDRLRELAGLAVRMLDNAIEVSRFPLPQQREEAFAKRRIGLGITGLADALIMCGARYGSPAAVALTELWLGTLRRAAYGASADLAAEKGAFPRFQRDAFLQGESVEDLEPELRAKIGEQGLRNGLITSIAPTGTISLLAGNLSSGLEPVFSLTHQRTLLLADGSREKLELSDRALALYRQLKGPDAPLTDAFVDTGSLSPDDHLVMQATVQRFVDSSVSKTINLPEDIGFEAFKEVYREADARGCKGCTTYRPNASRGAVLESLREPEDSARDEPPREPPATPPVAPSDSSGTPAEGAVVYMTEPLDRPATLPGRTYKLRWPESDHAIYITINDLIQDGRRRPFEIFINSKNMEHYAWTLALTRMISAVFRRGGDVSFVVEELKAVFDPRGGAWLDRRYVPSLLAAIGGVIERHLIDIGMLEPEEPARRAPDRGGRQGDPALRQCPKCGEAALIQQEGCDLCTACTYSKCA